MAMAGKETQGLLITDSLEKYAVDPASTSITTSTRGVHYYGIGNITKTIGVSVSCHEDEHALPLQAGDVPYDYTKISDLIRNENIKVEVRPMLVSFTGLPESGKSKVLQEFLEHYVEECPYAELSDDVITKKSIRPEGVGITQYELIADGSDPLANFTISEAMKVSYFTYGVLSAFKKTFMDERKIPVFNHTAKRERCFEDDDLEKSFMHMFQYFCNNSEIPKNSDDINMKARAAIGLEHSIPDCLTLINIWDHSISNVVRHLLSALQGHLYNHHMFLFLDLERDFEKLDEPPEIKHVDRNGAVFMKWRPRLHYLLRSAWATEKKGKERRRSCILFAKSEKTYTKTMKKVINHLEDRVYPVAKHIGVNKLLDKEIEIVNLNKDQKRIYRKIQHISSYVPAKKVPLAWLFLRSSFYYSSNMIIKKKDLQEKAFKCGMNEKSCSEFCKFYTSFGSIIDLSLANIKYDYVITKPVDFLKLLNTLLFPTDDKRQKYPTIDIGIVPESYCVESLDNNNWLLFMDVLVCLQLATRALDGFVKLPTGYSTVPLEIHHYISLCCRGDPITKVDSSAIHLITSINTPHFFKQVTIAKELLETMDGLRPKLLPSTSINELVIESLDTTITFSFHSPIIKINLSQPNSNICAHVVKAFQEIVSRANTMSGIKVKYKFIKACAKHKTVPDFQSLLSSRYHVLPYLDGTCEYCDSSDKEILNVWNETLDKYHIPREFKPTGVIDSKELSRIVEKMNPNIIDPGVFAETFIPNYTTHPQFSLLAGDRLVREALFSWYKKNKKGQIEPRRALAVKLSQLGEKVSQSGSQQNVQVLCETLAKEIDAYWKMKVTTPGKLQQLLTDERKKNTEQIDKLKNQLCEKEKELRQKNREIERLIHSSKQLIKGEIPKLALILKPVEDDWYQLGESLGVDKSLLDEINEKKGEEPLMESLLHTWFCKKEEITLTQLEKGLKVIGRDKLGLRLENIYLPVKVDQGVQFDYMIHLLERLDSLSDIHIAEKKLFQIQGNVPQLINWEQYGLRIGVSEGSFSHSETIDAAVIALIGGHFKFPVNTKLVSGVYAFSTSKPLLQSLRLEIQHCVDLGREDQVKRLKFAIAPINTSSLPYEFKIVEGGKFEIGSWYGSIDRDKFCFVCIISETDGAGGNQSEGKDNESQDSNSSSSDDDDDDEKEGSGGSGGQKSSGEGQGHHQEQQQHEIKNSPEIEDDDSLLKDVKKHVAEKQTEGASSAHHDMNHSTPRSTQSNNDVKGMTYTGLIYYEQDGAEDLVTFTAAKKLNILENYIKEKHKSAKIGQNVFFCFIANYIELQLNAHQKEPFNRWTIKCLLKPPRLYQRDIDDFGDKNFTFPPKCLISVYGSPDAVPSLYYDVPLEGVDRPITLVIHRSLRNYGKSMPLENSNVEVAHPLSSSACTPTATNKSLLPKGSIIKKLEQILQNQHNALEKSFNLSITSISSHLYQASIIGTDVRDSPNYKDIIASFLNGINFLNTLPQIESRCNKFLKAMSDVGGLDDAAKMLKDEWIKIVKDELEIELNL